MFSLNYLEDLEEGLLNSFSAHIAGNTHVLQLSRNLHDTATGGGAQGLTIDTLRPIATADFSRWNRQERNDMVKTRRVKAVTPLVNGIGNTTKEKVHSMESTYYEQAHWTICALTADASRTKQKSVAYSPPEPSRKRCFRVNPSTQCFSTLTSGHRSATYNREPRNHLQWHPLIAA